MTTNNHIPYNSAMKSCQAEFAGRDSLPEVDFFKNAYGSVFFHDMNVPFSKDELQLIDGASCVYAQLSWPQGMKIFADRANYRQRGSHAEYLKAVKHIIDRLRKPTFIICSESHSKILRPEKMMVIKLYKVKTFLASWRDFVDEKYYGADEVSIFFSQKYDSVYDFSCGYGRSIRGFNYLVGSDIDRKCLGYIKTEILEKKARP